MDLRCRNVLGFPGLEPDQPLPVMCDSISDFFFSFFLQGWGVGDSRDHVCPGKGEGGFVRAVQMESEETGRD